MQCNRCRNDAVFFQPYSGRHLCARHLVRDIEARAKRSIRSHHWMRPGDHIAVLPGSDRKSAALLCFMKKLTAGRQDIRLSAVLPKRDGAQNADRSIAREIAGSLQVPVVEKPPGRSVSAAPDRITKLASAITLDDAALGVLGEFLSGNVDRLLDNPRDNDRAIKVICPFIAIPSDELDLYWEIEGSGISLPPGTPYGKPLFEDIATVFEEYCHRHPATHYAILHLAEQIAGGNAVTAGSGENRTDLLCRTLIQAGGSDGA